MGRVKINPEALKWARIDSGYTYSNLPNKIKSKFPEWESGNVMPTWNQLCDISNYFKRPTAFFFRTRFPEHINMDLIEYRKLKDAQYVEKSPTLTIGIRESIYKREKFLKLLEDMHHSKNIFSRHALKTDNATDLSNHMRDILDVPLNEQKSWLHNNGRRDSLHYNFLNQWKDNISSKLGILIFEIPRVSLEEMRAICIYYDEHPIILLNSADSPNARIFSLFHELTHLLFGESAICDVKSDNSKEWFCNSVAGEFLIPKNDLKNNPLVKCSDGKWTDEKILRLSHEYGVSKETIFLRLISIKKAEQEDYIQMKEKWMLNRKRSVFQGGSPVLNQMKYNGRLYTSVMLSAYENGIISSVEFSQNIGLRLKHIDELYEKLYG